MENSLFKEKNVLITGATGLIGSYLVRKMLKLGANVIALGRNAQKIESVFKDEIKCENFRLISMNISKSFPENIGNVHYIFHAASPISGAEIAYKPVDTIETNLSGMKNCLEFLKKQKDEKKINGKMIVFSSATVYGNPSESDSTFTEEQTNHAEQLEAIATPYSESKRMIEVLARSYYIQYGVEVVIARMGYVYGYATYKPNTAFYEFVEKALERNDIVINNSGMGKRDNIYVKDVVEGLVLIAEKGKLGEAYNISSNGEKGNYSAIDQIADIIAFCSNEMMDGKKIEVKVRNFEKNRKPGVKLNNDKIKELGWKVTTDLKNGIKETICLYMN
mgnify:FL=1|jgi:nucleoside-diphosphate-sugar epimerase